MPDTVPNTATGQTRSTKLAGAVARFIDKQPKTRPFTLAINGPWGSGKSTLVQELQRSLDEDVSHQHAYPHVVFRFDAWLHADAASLGGALIAAVTRFVAEQRPWWRRLRSPLPTELLAPSQRFERKAFLVVVTCLAALGLTLVAVRLGLTRSESVVAKALEELFGITLSPKELNGLGALGTPVFFGLALTMLRRWLEIARNIGGFIKDPRSEASYGTIAVVREQLGEMIRHAMPEGSRLIVIIDELDRCESGQCIELLETINQFLVHPNVVVVLVADVSLLGIHAEIKHDALAARVAPNTELKATTERAGGFGYLFLEKLIDVQFDVPSLPAEEAFVGPSETHPEPSPVSIRASILLPRTNPFSYASGYAAPEESSAPRHPNRHVLMLTGPIRDLWKTAPSLKNLWNVILYFALLPARMTLLVASTAAFEYRYRPRQPPAALERMDRALKPVILAFLGCVYALVFAGVVHVECGPTNRVVWYVLWSLFALTTTCLVVPVYFPLKAEAKKAKPVENSGTTVPGTTIPESPISLSPKLQLRRALLLDLLTEIAPLLASPEMFGGSVLPRWASLVVRWPALARTLKREPERLRVLEDAASAETRTPEAEAWTIVDSELSRLLRLNAPTDGPMSPFLERLMGLDPNVDKRLIEPSQERTAA